jgi:hypothetical protein
MGSCLSIAGNCSSAAVLLTADLLVTLIQASARGLADVIDCASQSGKNTARNKIAWHEQRVFSTPVYAQQRGEKGWFGELDVPRTLETSTFPIKPEDLILKAKAVLASEFGTAEGCDSSCLADDFQFVAPIVGPLSKTEFLRAFGSFKIMDALPDISDNMWFQVDPLEPNRVWWFSRMTGTHTGTLNFGGGSYAGTGKEVKMPPQAQSLLFDTSGKVYTITVGYAMDKRIGNTDGLGGVFGIVKAVGKPLPFDEGKRLFTPSLRFEAFERIGKAVEGFGYDPATGQKIAPAGKC